MCTCIKNECAQYTINGISTKTILFHKGLFRVQVPCASHTLIMNDKMTRIGIYSGNMLQWYLKNRDSNFIALAIKDIKQTGRIKYERVISNKGILT